MLDAAKLSTELRRRGYSYEDAMRYLRGPRAFDLADAYTLYAPWDAPVRDGLEDLRVLKADRGVSEKFPRPAWTALDVDRGSVVMVSPLKSWTREDDMEICWGDDPHAASCGRLRDGAWERLLAGTSFRQRLFALNLSGWWDPPASARAIKEWLKVPIVIDSADPFHDIDLVASSASESEWWTPWKLDQIEGVDASVDGAHQRVTIRSGGEHHGIMRWLRVTDADHARTLVLPQYLETLPEEEAVRVALRTAGGLQGFLR
jgi:hypothetical protein